MSEYFVVTGLSGAGRSQAADVFEDLGWFVIDNLPPTLLPKVMELADAPGSSIDRVALVVGAGTYQEQVVGAIEELHGAIPDVRILFLEATTPELVRRYEQTRRRHPMGTIGGSLSDAIERERELLEPVLGLADVRIDTTELNVHQLRDRIQDLLERPAGHLRTSVRSFGFKHGLPLDADLVFDVRHLPNPHWVDELRPQTGLDAPVREYVLASDGTAVLLDKLIDLFLLLLPAYEAEGKAYCTIAVGCTGGRHRSVVVAEAIGARLREAGHDVGVSHRDVER